MENPSTQPEGARPDEGTSPPVAFPADMLGALVDLLSRQKEWQERQARSEELVNRMAAQFEQSRKTIERLSGLLGEPRPPAAPAPVNGGIPPHSPQPAARGDPPPGPAPAPPAAPPKTATGAEPEFLTWEMQKQMLLNGHLGNGAPPATPPREPASDALPAPPPAAPAPPVETVQSAAANESKNGNWDTSAPFHLLDKDELAFLGECDQSEELRRMRRKLEEKLRDAEIEISIERARISRARRELEQLRSDFEMEVRRMRDEEPAGKGKGNRQTSRWNRFLRNADT